ncbi:MAG TPA: N(5)-(carboxyethyl)ornithine synthase [Calditrichia bacterium]|nr:N(5)-(carboxyethyl)ornithine synthase [Calditrichia bacterium]
MALLKVGVFGTSAKENEMRVPIHPGQIEWLDPEIRENLYFENGYGDPFGAPDSRIGELSGGLRSREELFRESDILLLPKPLPEDFRAMREGSIHWGWPHCVQQRDNTQIAIDRRLTLIAWEAMHQWSPSGEWQMHTFYKNNEMAGYAGVLDALRQVGIDGNYGPPRKAVVISFGSVSRGAVYALQGRGFRDITVYTQRYAPFVHDQAMGVEYRHYEEDEKGRLMGVEPDGTTIPLIEILGAADIIVNGILQDTDHALMFVDRDQLEQLKPGTLIVDVSCDEGMGFYFARPTSFAEPMFKVGEVFYYAVDHTPSYLWNSASWEISTSLLPFLPTIMEGPQSWAGNETVRRAIEIRDGEILNPKILSFQNRAEAYPHAVVGE